MIYWLVILAALIIFSIIALTLIQNDVTDVFSIFMLTFVGIMLIVILCIRIDYNKFEAQIEIQRAQYEQLIEKGNSSEVILIEDILSINQDLSEMKASRLTYNNWSLYPERVLDIQPIGLE